MVSTRKKRQSDRRLLSQLDDFDGDMIIGNAASVRRENIVSMRVLMTERLPLVLPVKTQRLMKTW